MLFLFASLPSTSTIPPKTIALCQRLCLEFQHYIIVSHSLRKSFLSIKGIYYQATIQGQDILWLVPYKFVQRVTGDIDFRIMGTFIEFYTTLLGFVNFRLYTSASLIYPPRFDAKSDEHGAELGAFTLEGRDIANSLLTNGSSTTTDEAATARAQAAANSLTSAADASSATDDATAEDADADPASTNIIDTFTSTDPAADTLAQPSAGVTVASTLFGPMTFYLSRETPRQPLEFLLKAFGSKRVGWDAVLGEGYYTSNELDPSITHQIVDRPPQADVPDDADVEASARGQRVPGRVYVQPQYVWDCINEGKILRPDLYEPGAILPPHLSPWVKASRGAYDPTAPLEADEDGMDVDAGGKDASVVEGVDSVKAIADLNGASDASDDEEPEVASGDEDQSADSDGDAEITLDAANDDFGGFSGDEEEEDADISSHQRELEAEAAGRTPKAEKPAAGAKQTKAQKEKAKVKKEEEEAMERAKMMMPRKKRKLLEKMQYGNARRDEEKEKLVAKRRKLEKAGKR
jgi:pescadillo protein